MIFISYIITKYLTPPKYGFTHAEPNDPQLAGLLQLESLVVAQTFHQTTTTESEKHFDFGGGSLRNYEVRSKELERNLPYAQI